MIRGTNQEFRYKLPYNFSELNIIRIAFWQDNYSGPESYRPLPIIKVKAQCRQGDQPNILRVVLNQEETLRFTEKRKAKVQLRAITTSGIPFATLEHLEPVYPVFDDSILDGEVIPTPTYEDFIMLDGQHIIQGG